MTTTEKTSLVTKWRMRAEFDHRETAEKMEELLKKLEEQFLKAVEDKGGKMCDRKINFEINTYRSSVR